VTNPTSLEESLAAGAHLDEMILDTAALKEATGTDTSLHGAVTTGTETTAGAEVRKGAEVATGTREDSAAKLHEAITFTTSASSGDLNG